MNEETKLKGYLVCRKLDFRVVLLWFGGIRRGERRVFIGENGVGRLVVLSKLPITFLLLCKANSWLTILVLS